MFCSPFSTILKLLECIHYFLVFQVFQRNLKLNRYTDCKNNYCISCSSFCMHKFSDSWFCTLKPQSFIRQHYSFMQLSHLVVYYKHASRKKLKGRFLEANSVWLQTLFCEKLFQQCPLKFLFLLGNYASRKIRYQNMEEIYYHGYARLKRPLPIDSLGYRATEPGGRFTHLPEIPSNPNNQ